MKLFTIYIYIKFLDLVSILKNNYKISEEKCVLANYLSIYS